VSQHERVARLAQELDEVGVVARRYVRQPRVRGVDVRGDGRLQQDAKRGPFVRQTFHHAAPGRPATAATTVVPVMMMVMVVMVMVMVFTCRQRTIYRFRFFTKLLL